MTRVKICGLTRLSDARVAVAAGADALGVVLHAPGARRLVTLARAAEVFAEVPAFVARVGVFVDAPLAFVEEAVAKLKLHAAQLHGGEPAEYTAGVPCDVIKRADADRAAEWGQVRAVLVDAPGGGGRGVANDWDAVERGLRGATVPVVLAGGLTAENVAGVVARFAPWGVDVSSGVEGPVVGEKDAGRVRAFVRAAREVVVTR